MKLDFSGTEQSSDFVTVPPGTYLCRIAEVVPGTTRNGHTRWGVRLVVAEGEFVGRVAAWDGLVFTERGMARVRRVFEVLGLPCAGEVEVEPEQLVERQAFVTIKPDDYQDPVTGHSTRRNAVPYDGYRPVPDDQQVSSTRSDAVVDDDDIPF